MPRRPGYPSVVALAQPGLHRVAYALTAVLGVVGVWLVADGAGAGVPLHRVAAVALGVALACPAALAMVGRRGRRWSRRLLLSGAALAVTLLVGEGLVRLLGLGAHGPTRMVEDPVLGLMGVPGTGDLDANGFRNGAIPLAPQVVCLGDSNTYGFKVRRERAFPSVLAAQSGWSVYSMSHGGYGPLQYATLTARALAAEPPPKVVLIALYFGNDIVDAHRYLGLEGAARFRQPGAPVPPATGFLPTPKPAPNIAMACLDVFRERSRLIGWAAHVLTSKLRENAALGAMAAQEPGSPRHIGGRESTVFTPRARMATLDLARAEVRDGLRVTRMCLEDAANNCHRRGAVPVLMLLPTKESVYHRWLEGNGSSTVEALAPLAAMEAEVAAELRATAAAVGMVVVDAGDALVEWLARSEAAYWATADGHLAAGGCAAVGGHLARVLAPWVRD